jgi:hypothetical protein
LDTTVLVRFIFRRSCKKHSFDRWTDIDWEYPGGNGADYKQIPNSKKKGEVAAYPKLLREIKKAIGTKELAITVPGLERDMIAFTAKEGPLINGAVDFVTVCGTIQKTRNSIS